MDGLRFSHFDAVFDERDPFSDEGVPLSDFPGVNSFALVVVDGLRTGRPEVWIFWRIIVHLGGKFIQAVQS